MNAFQPRPRLLLLVVAAVVACGGASHRGPLRVEKLLSVPTPDGGVVHADAYGEGKSAVVLVGHGGYSSRESWETPARTLAESGFRVLVIATRASDSLRAGKETECLYDAVCMAVDVLSAVRWLRGTGVTTVAVVGGSAGGGAAAQASVDAVPGEIDRIVLLAPMSIDAPEKMKGRTLYITSRDDLGPDDTPRLPGISDQYAKAPDPKQLVILEGSAHGQRIFGTPQGERMMREIVRFLSER